MEINLDTLQIKEIVLDRLKNKEKLCLTRIGDGEIAILRRNIDPKGANHFYNVHLGRDLDEISMNEINKNLTNSIIKSDILGIPHFIAENSGNPYWKVGKEMISNILKIFPNENQKYCFMGVHHVMLIDKTLYDIISSVEELYVVTSRDIEEKLKKKFPNLKNIHTYKIPGEFLYEDDKKYENYYPNIYKSIEEDFKNRDFSGKLLLLGGGFVGKNLGIIFAERGGVSLDIGSVFDSLIGKMTRGQGKGPNKYKEPLI